MRQQVTGTRVGSAVRTVLSRASINLVRTADPTPFAIPSHAPIVALAVSDHGPFSPRVLTQRTM